MTAVAPAPITIECATIFSTFSTSSGAAGYRFHGAAEK
jgi:hypothetical protein